jgi:iron complex transport system ATP-binding protein
MSGILSLRDVSFSADGAVILDGITFSLQRGGYLSIIGPNGAGKSTLLKCLMRLHENGRTTGAISLNGRALASFSQKELARNMAYVPQAGGRIPPFTVREFLYLSRYPYAARKEAAQDAGAVDEALRLTGLSDLASRRLDTLSGGERQRACLAAALAQEAGLLLLDEPASFLDPRHAAELHRLLKMLNREQGLTLITVTHDLNHPPDAGGEILVLRRGRQTFYGSADALEHEGVLEEAFAHTFTYVRHPATGRPVVLPDQA